MTEQYLYLTTTGWKSGEPHEIEIWFVALNGRYYLISEKRQRAHWVQNLQREPAVTFRVSEVTYRGTARTLPAGTDDTTREQVSALMKDKYGWNNGLIVELSPEETV